MSARLILHTAFRLAAAALAGIAAAACSSDPAIEEAGAPVQGVVLSLSTGSTFTRADDGHDLGEDPYSESVDGTREEEAINSVALFFFDNDKTEDKAFYVETVAPSAFTKADLVVKVPIDKLDKFNVDGSKVYVYALANLPASVSVVKGVDGTIAGKEPTLDLLKNEVWVYEPEFVGEPDSGSASTKAPHVPQSFVMRGGGEVELVEQEGKLAYAKGTILLERLASKIRLWAEVPVEIYVDNNSGRTLNKEDYTDAEGHLDTEAWNAAISADNVEHWVPVTRDNQGWTMQLYMSNIAQQGRISGDVRAFYGEGVDERDEHLRYGSVDRGDTKVFARTIVRPKESGESDDFEYLNLRYADMPANNSNESYCKYTYSHNVAYYSYPNVWDSKQAADMRKSYVIVTLPWRMEKDNETKYQVCYYQIPVNALVGEGADGRAADCLEPNCYYRIRVSIGMLGSKDLGAPTPIEDASWEVVPWKEAPVDVIIKDRRYLVVNQTNWTVNNEARLEIPFSTSHPVEKVFCYVTYFRYNDVWGTDPKTDPNYISDKTGANATHKNDEFDAWLSLAETAGIKKSGGEGLLNIDDYKDANGNKKKVDALNGDILYYKDEYFYDKYYNTLKVNDGYKYYLGHEHPKTFRTDALSYDESKMKDYTYTGLDGKTRITDNVQKQKRAWELYNSNETWKKDIQNEIYTCDIDNDNNLIILVHPLVQWQEFRDNDGKIQYYYPILNPHSNDNSLWEEFSRCEITIKIKHEDYDKNDGLFEETVHVTQYPGMYVEVSHDYGDVFENNNSKGNDYILVNGETTQDGTEAGTKWYEVTSYVRYFGDINNNPNMYVIHTTQLSEYDNTFLDENKVTQTYILGDPRMLHYNNNLSTKLDRNEPNLGNWWTGDYRLNSDNNINDDGNDVKNSSDRGEDYWDCITTGYQRIVSAPRLNDSKKSGRLQTYYPADESKGAGSKKNFVAPSFRIASSLGKVSLVYPRTFGSAVNGYSRAEARRRCAAYQEAGRPAGRWRVPTFAEIQYLLRLSTDGKIPHLFGDNKNTKQYVPYWSANGLVGVCLDTDMDVADRIKMYVDEIDLTTDPAVRCVYDEWYWKQINERLDYDPDPLEKTFYWGDVPKDNTQAPPVEPEETEDPDKN